MFVKDKVQTYLREIFKVYGNELLLRLEEYNLLSSDNNCIETSTATGFIMEEFITSKLEIYTQNHNSINDIVVRKLSDQSTVNSSYDCYVNYNNIFVMINIKVQKNGASNNAVAAINILHNDYVSTNVNNEKSYMILKTFYDFGISPKDRERKILISGVDAYCLEEIDFSCGHKQDHRNWSADFKANSGRLQIPPSWLKDHKMDKNDVSYFKTKSFIDDIYNGSNPEI
ncbi:hypothetical protein WG617_01860 [Mycoplasmopsis felifaucium]|uniref:Uncharacterized protein n=2 Tax=Mycoplasmopsis felifaucium TaxID=35768 RepID=A0ABZ2RWS6_9BACT